MSSPNADPTRPASSRSGLGRSNPPADTDVHRAGAISAGGDDFRGTGPNGGPGSIPTGGGNGPGAVPARQTVTDRFAVLSEFTRLRLLRLLEQSELTVSELATILQMPQSTVSRHLKVLLEGGWIIRRAAGTAGRYQLSLEALDEPSRELWLVARQQLGATPPIDQDNHRLAEVLRQRRPDTQAFFGRVGAQWDAMRTELFGMNFGDEAFRGLIDPDSVVVDLGCGTGNLTAKIAPHVAVVHAVDQSSAMLQAARRLVLERAYALGRLSSEGARDSDDTVDPDRPGRSGAIGRTPAGVAEAVDVEAESDADAAGEPIVLPAMGPGDVVARSAVHFHQADVLSLPLHDGEADLAVISLVLHHLDDPGRVLAEAARILRPGRGRLLIIDMLAHDRDEYRFSMGHRWLGFEPGRMRAWIAEAGFDRVHLWRLTPDPDARGPDLFAAIAWRQPSGQ